MYLLLFSKEGQKNPEHVFNIKYNSNIIISILEKKSKKIKISKKRNRRLIN